MKYQGIVFDLDNTLYDETEYFREVLRVFCEKTGSECSVDALIEAYRLHRPYSRDIFGDILRATQMTDNLQENKDILFLLYATADMHLVPFGDVLDFLSYLKTNNIKIGLLTNGVVEAQQNKLKSLGIQNFFDVVCYARSYGKDNEKPSFKPFVEIAKEMHIPGERLAFVGDNPEHDFYGAKRIGACTIRVRRGLYSKHRSNSSIDFETDTISQVKDLLF